MALTPAEIDEAAALLDEEERANTELLQRDAAEAWADPAFYERRQEEQFAPPSPAPDGLTRNEIDRAADVMLEEERANDRAFLRESLSMSYQTQPEQEASYLRIARHFGVNKEYVKQNLPRLLGSIEAAEWDADKWAKRNPEQFELAKNKPYAAQIIVRDESLSVLSKAARAMSAAVDAAGRDDGAAVKTLRTLSPIADLAMSAFEVAEAADAGELTAAMEPRQVPMLDDGRAMLGRSGSSVDRVWMAVKDSDVRRQIAATGSEIVRGKIMGRDVSEAEARLVALKEEGALRYYNMSGGEQFFVDAYEGISSQFDVLKGGLQGAAAGAGTGGTLGLAAGAAAGPGAVAAGKAGALTGARVGFRLGAAYSSFNTEMGSFYVEFREETTDDGKRIPDDVALGAAILYGLAAASVESMSFGATQKAFGPIGKAIKQGRGAKAIAEAVKDEGFRKLATDAALEFGKSGGIEGVEEFAQTYLDGLIGWQAKTYQANKGEGTAGVASGAGAALGETAAFFTEDALEPDWMRADRRQTLDEQALRTEAFEAMTKTWASVPALVAGGGALSVSVNYAVGSIKYGAARKSEAVVEKLVDAAVGPTAKADPASAAEVYASASAKSGVPGDSVYIDPAGLVGVLTTQSLDPEQVLGVERMAEVGEAGDTGAMVQMPTVEFIRLVQKLKDPKELQQHVVTSPGLPTPFRLNQEEDESETQAEEMADEFMKDMGSEDPDEAAQQKDKGQQVRAALVASIRDSLVAAGMTKADARAVQRLWSQYLKSVAVQFKGASSNPLRDLKVQVTADGRPVGLRLDTAVEEKAPAEAAAPAPAAPTPAETEASPTAPVPAGAAPAASEDPTYAERVQAVLQLQSISVAALKRMFPLKDAEAKALMARLEADGIVGPARGSNPRKVLGVKPKAEGVAAPAEPTLSSPAAEPQAPADPPPVNAGEVAVGGSVVVGSGSVVRTPQRVFRSAYALMEADSLVASHNEESFAPNPEYVERTGNAQQRLYAQDKNEQLKANQAIKPDFVLTDTPTAIDGPPMVTAGETPLVMGGNGRTMMLKLAYARGSADGYRAELRSKAQSFGVLPEAVDAMRKPVLVRVLVDLTTQSPHDEMRDAVAFLNEGFTQAVSETAQAISDARRLSTETIGEIGTIMSERDDLTLRKVMSEKSGEIVVMLRRDGIITQQNAGDWLDNGKLSDGAKTRIEAMFVGRILETPERYNATPYRVATKIERIVPHLLKVDGVNRSYSEIETVRKAVDAIIEANARGIDVAALAGQADVVKGIKDKKVAQFAEAILTKGLNNLGSDFKEWARMASFDPSQSTMLIPNPTRDEAIAPIVSKVVAEKGKDGTATVTATPTLQNVPKTEQKDGTVRGYAEKLDANTYKIHLTKDATLATILHESAHVFFNINADLALRQDAPKKFRDDFDAALKFAGFADPADLRAKSAEAAQIQAVLLSEKREPSKKEKARLKELVAPHEKFARAFEAYLREGKAPSPTLISTFNRFSMWLKRVYVTARRLNVTLNDEIRGVFDRMLLVDEEMDKALRAMGGIPPFPMPGPERLITVPPYLRKGLTPEEYERALELWKKATTGVAQAAQRELLREELRPLDEEWKDKIEEVTPRAEQDYENLSVTRLYAWMDDQAKAKTRVSFNVDKVVEAIGEDRAKAIPTSKDGALPDEVADMFEFATGKEMLEAMVSREPKSVWVRKRAEEIAKARFGDLAEKREKLREQLTKGLHNKYYKLWLRHEWKVLRKLSGEAEVPVTAIERAAQKLVSSMKLKGFSARKLLIRQNAAANRSIRLAAGGNYAGAAVAKQQQILAHFMYDEASAITTEMNGFSRLVRQLKKKDARARAGKASLSLLDGIDVVLEALSAKPKERRERTPATVAEVTTTLVNTGLTISYDEAIVDRVLATAADRDPDVLIKNMGALSVEEFRNVHAYLSLINKAAILRTQLEMRGRAIEIEEAVSRLSKETERLGSTVLGSSQKAEGVKRGVGLILDEADAFLSNTETMLLKLGGGRDSDWYRLIMEPLQNAKYEKAKLTRDFVRPVADRFEKLPARVLSSFTDSFDGKRYFPGHAIDSNIQLAPPTKKFELLMMLLNAGNASNLSRLLIGRNITFQQLKTAFEENLTAEDVAWAQSVLDDCEKLWPLARDLEERETGLAPKKIEAQSFALKTKDGDTVTFRGGYFPVRYDSRVSVIGEKQDDEKLGLHASLFDSNVIRPGTSRPHLQNRVEGYTDVIALEPGTFTTHLDSVIHDLAYRQAVRQAGLLLTNKTVQGIVTSKLGKAYTKTLIPYLRDVARVTTFERIAESNWFYRVARKTRVKLMASALGYGINVLAGDIVNSFNAVTAGGVSVRSYSKSAFRLLKPFKFYRRVQEVRKISGEARARSEESAERLRRMVDSATTSRLSLDYLEEPKALRRFNDFAFSFMHTLESVNTTIVFDAAYEDHRRRGLDHNAAVRMADAAVRDSIASRDNVDLSPFMRDKGFIGASHVFVGFANFLYNSQRRMFNEIVDPDTRWSSRAALLGRMAALMVVQGPIAELLMGRGKEDDEEMEDWLTRKSVAGVLGLIPFGGEMVGAYEELVLGRQSGLRASPIASAIASAAKSYKKAFSDDFDGFEKFEAATRTTATVVKIAGVNQFFKTGKYLKNAADGYESADTPLQSLSGVVYGERYEGQPDNPILMMDRVINGKDF